jgi:hypothetical protein
MAKKKDNPAYFERRAVLEVLEDKDLPVAEALKLQYRLCELNMEIYSHEKKRTAESKSTFRKLPAKSRVNEPEMSDFRAFKHLLTVKEICKKYKVSTLNSWRNKLNKGILPPPFLKVLKSNGYKVIQERKWQKPNSKK